MQIRKIGAIACFMLLCMSSTGYAGPADNQPALFEALGRCDDQMVAMVLQRGGVDLKQPAVMDRVLQGLFTEAPNDPMAHIARCTANIDLLLQHGLKPELSSDENADDLFDKLLFHVAVFSAPGYPPADEKRMKLPFNGAMRGVRVLQVLEKNGYDFRHMMLPTYAGTSVLKLRKKFTAKEDANLLMKLAASARFQDAATLVATKQNSFVVSMMFFAWVMNQTPIDTINSQGKTALMFAAQIGGAAVANQKVSSVALIGFLLEQGADKGIKDKSGKTALDYALASGDLDAAKLLK